MINKSVSEMTFIEKEVFKDIQEGRYTRPVCVRFPPEPNGYMHVGHAKAVMVNIEVRNTFGGLFNFRLDDTNPAAETREYADSLREDLEWFIGESVEGRVFHASSFFDQIDQAAIKLINKGLAFVDQSSSDEIREMRGNFFIAGRPSPYRDQPKQESLRLFNEMLEGKHRPGSMVLRAKIDYNSPNMNLRDPLIYRILDIQHHNLKSQRFAYPLYDFAHPLCDAFEGVTHSLCGMEFEGHRPLYTWFLESLEIPEPPRQIEFAEVNIEGVVLAKRHLRPLIESNIVEGWNDPRLLTIKALQRRGFPAKSIRDFCLRLTGSRTIGTIDFDLLEQCIRADLNKLAIRVMVVKDPIKLTIRNLPDDYILHTKGLINPEDKKSDTRQIRLSKNLLIEREDFAITPLPRFYRLSPGKTVRLRYGFIVRCVDHILDSNGLVTEVIADAYPETIGGKKLPGEKTEGIIHWVSTEDAVPVEIREYDNLFLPEIRDFDGTQPIENYLNPDSLKIIKGFSEPFIVNINRNEYVQFERLGYYYQDLSSVENKLVYNKTTKLRDTNKPI